MGSSKNVLQSYHLVTDGDMSGDVTSSALNIAFLDNIGFQFIWTGTPVGTFSVEVSTNGQWNGTVWTGTTWTALTFSPDITAPAGSASNTVADPIQVSCPAIRVKYTAGSSTGTLQVWASGKSI